MATHSSILAWEISGTEEPGGLQSVQLQRVRHDWSDWAHRPAFSFGLKHPPFSRVISSLTHVFLKHVVSFPDIWGFPRWFSAVGFWLCAVSVLLSILRRDLWPSTHSILEWFQVRSGRACFCPCWVGCLCVSGLVGCSVVHVLSVFSDFLTGCSVTQRRVLESPTALFNFFLPVLSAFASCTLRLLR